MKTLFLLFLFLIPAKGWAATYYTAKTCTGGTSPPNCNNANAGTTRQTAKLTIAAGIALMSPGDTLQVGSGTYSEYITNTIPSGSAGAPTIIQNVAATGGTSGEIVWVTPASGAVGANYIIESTGSYITIDGS